MTDKHYVGPIQPGATDEELRALGRELFDKIQGAQGETDHDEEPSGDPDVR